MEAGEVGGQAIDNRFWVSGSSGSTRYGNGSRGALGKNTSKQYGKGYVSHPSNTVL